MARATSPDTRRLSEDPQPPQLPTATQCGRTVHTDGTQMYCPCTFQPGCDTLTIRLPRNAAQNHPALIDRLLFSHNFSCQLHLRPSHFGFQLPPVPHFTLSFDSAHLFVVVGVRNLTQSFKVGNEFLRSHGRFAPGRCRCYGRNAPSCNCEVAHEQVCSEFIIDVCCHRS